MRKRNRPNCIPKYLDLRVRECHDRPVPRVRHAFPKALSLYLTTEQDAAIRAVARARGVPVCAYARDVIAAYLAQRAADAAAKHPPRAPQDGAPATHRKPVTFQIWRPTGQPAPPPMPPDQHGGPPLAWDLRDAAVPVPPAAAGLGRGAV